MACLEALRSGVAPQKLGKGKGNKEPDEPEVRVLFQPPHTHSLPATMPIKLAQPAGPYPGKINNAASTIWVFSTRYIIWKRNWGGGATAR
jgi:hypothetical protein